MAVYLLHFDRPLDGGQRPQHYLGWTPDDPEARLADHLADRNRAARIVVAAATYGIEVRIARTWPEGDRLMESRLKRAKRGYRHLCPLCNQEVT